LDQVFLSFQNRFFLTQTSRSYAFKLYW
jgi:hypothetical protein